MSIVPFDESRRRPGRVPPHNIEAEESVLGAMILSPRAIDDVTDVLDGPEDFYKPANAHFYAAIVELYLRGQPTDPVTVADHLRQTGLLDQVGGGGAIAGLQNRVPSTGNARSYARIVARLASYRRMISVAGEIADMAYAAPDELETALDRAETLLFALADRRKSDVANLGWGDMLHAALDRLEQRAAGDLAAGLPVGFSDYDDITGGYVDGSLNIVAGRPGTGKTMWLTQCAVNIAEAGRPVLFVSAEMSDKELGDRALAHVGRTSLARLRRGLLTPGDWPRLTDGVAHLGSLPIFLHVEGAPTLTGIRSRLRRLASGLGAMPVLIVDYLQLLGGAGRTENRQAEVAEYSRGLKRIAVDLHTEAIVACQLNRNLESRGDKRPVMSDLRESGAIENDADTVTFLYRDEMYGPKPENKGTAELIVAKNRHGAPGRADAAFIADTGRFELLRRF